MADGQDDSQPPTSQEQGPTAPPSYMPDATQYPPQGAPPSGNIEQTDSLNTALYPHTTQGAYPPPNTAPYPPGQQDPSYPPPGPGVVNPASEQPPPYPGPPAAIYPPQQGYQQGYQQSGVDPGQNDPSVKVQPQQQPNVVIVQSNQPHPQQPNPNIAIVRTVQISSGSQPETYLVMSIISIFCCLIFGIVAVVYATQVSSLWAQGRQSEARGASAKAKGFAIAAIVIGLVVIAINMINAFVV